MVVGQPKAYGRRSGRAKTAEGVRESSGKKRKAVEVDSNDDDDDDDGDEEEEVEEVVEDGDGDKNDDEVADDEVDADEVDDEDGDVDFSADEDEEGDDEDWLHEATTKDEKKESKSAKKRVVRTKVVAKGAGGAKKRKTGNSKTSSSSREVGESKSAAEFFAENQSIAGFDNRGRSLYTTIRELVENSLDACESAEVLPDIHVNVEELTQAQFNELRGMTAGTETKAGTDDPSNAKNKGEQDARDVPPTKNSTEENTNSAAKKKKKGSSSSAVAAEAYFRISVRDNGCGMAHDAIPDLLGRVLSGSKYGVRQTRGKFGLGAKMALIWSKKSTGVPITVKTALSSATSNPAARTPASHFSTCVLDIDIYHNEPRIIKHTSIDNSVQKWVGTQMSLVIAGNWTSYRSWILQYLQQLAIITPYANLELLYQNRSEPQRNISVRYDRRSEQMPSAAREVKHHPSSVNNLIIHQLLQRTKCKTLLKFLSTDLSSIGTAVAKRLLQELQQSLPSKETLDESSPPSELTDLQITRLVQLLRRGKVSASSGTTGGASKLFKAPDASCLSPLGEYNLNLGIRKVLEPEVVATARDRAGAHDGHPFLVEAAVSIGGKAVPEGITVFRFANRIPLLFESFADVATRVAQRRVRWANYKIDQRRDRIGVFVSIVSTKIPFKGTGKEYIGDDIVEIQQSVKRALQSCCQQLRSHLTKRNALREARERQSRLAKYIPDISRSLIGILTTMQERQKDDHETGRSESPRKLTAVAKASQGGNENLVKSLQLDSLTEDKIAQRLKEAIKQQGEGLENTQDGGIHDMEAGDKKGKDHSKDGERSVFLVPMHRLEEPEFAERDLRHPLFVFRPMFT